MSETYLIIVENWWKSMNPQAHDDEKIDARHTPTSYRAELRRCDSIDAVIMTAGFRSLWQQLPDEITGNPSAKCLEIWGTIAAVLSHVKKLSDSDIATAAGTPDNDKSRVSELRFKQLQAAKTPEDLLLSLRRIIQQLKGTVSVRSLVKDINQWFLEFNTKEKISVNERIAIRWAMAYYKASPKKTKK